MNAKTRAAYSGFAFAFALASAQAATATPTAAMAGAEACRVVAMAHNIVVTGLPPGTGGKLCVGDAKRRDGKQCRDMRADANGAIAAYQPDVVAAPAWFLPETGAAACSAAPIFAPDQTATLWLPLLALLTGLVSGLLAIYLPMRGARRERSRLTAAQWLAEFEARLQAYGRDASVDPMPRPLPVVERREAEYLGRIIALAHRILDQGGYAPVLSEADRRKIVATIIAGIAEIMRHPMPPSEPDTALT